MSAYGIEYLDDAMRNLGEMTDYAVNACGMDLEDFWKFVSYNRVCRKIWGRCTKSSERLFWNGACGGSASKSGKKGRTAGTAGRIYLFQRVLEWLDTGVLSVYSEKKFKEIEAGFRSGRLWKCIRHFMKLRRINLLRRQTESFEEKSRGKTRCGGSGRWRDIPKRIFQSNRGLRCGVFSSMNREKRRFKKASAETVRALARSLGCQMEDLL